MKNEYYISDSQNVLQNETSRKMAKEVSWKYHKLVDMHHKNANKKQKKATKTHKKILFSNNKYPIFSL